MTHKTLAAARRIIAGEYPIGIIAEEYPIDDVLRDAAEVARELLAAAETRAAVVEECARIFEAKALIHAAQATWIGPQRQRYEGIRPTGVEAWPMNGPAISYDREMANATEVRALAAQPQEKGDE